MKRIKFLLFALLAFMAVGCGRSVPEWTGTDSLALMQDSVNVDENYLFSVNDNFVVVADSLNLEADSLERNALMGRIDTLNRVLRGDLVVVADFAINPKDSVDSVWVKVARDQYTIGWVRESELKMAVVPDDPISQFIHYFSNFNRVVFLLLTVLAVLAYVYRLARRKSLPFVHFNDIDSPYPTLLCLAVSGAAVFYGSIQHFAPDTWVHFYYYPTLNPFILPTGMACFITCVWAVILLFVAVLDEAFRKLPFVESIYYLTSLWCVCMLCYVFFSLSTPFYIGYFCFVLYVVFAVISYVRMRHYHCGSCGAVLPSADCVCPKCGARNIR